jgi:cobalt-zinc-cadmium efflux system membrane fusion protein
MKRAAPALILAALACGHRGAPPPEAAPPASEVWLTSAQTQSAGLELAPVAVLPVGGLLQASARLTFDDRRVTHVFSPVGGRVTRLLADLGQHVRAGQPLALIDSPDLGSALADARKAEAAFAAADREFERQKELFAAQAGAKRDLEAAEAAFRNAQAERDRARQRAAFLHAPDARGVSQGFELRAPIAGEVISRTLNPGTDVAGQYGGGGATELFTLGDLDSLWLMADLYEQDLFQVKVGSPVQAVIPGYPPGPVATRVDWISGTLDPVTRTARIRCVVPNRAHLLRPEMLAKALIQVPLERVLAIPRAAVVRLGSLTCAFVALPPGPGGTRRFERRPVQVDEQVAGDLVPVKGGLMAGEQVVARGALVLAGLS